MCLNMCVKDVLGNKLPKDCTQVHLINGPVYSVCTVGNWLPPVYAGRVSFCCIRHVNNNVGGLSECMGIIAAKHGPVNSTVDRVSE